jgi:hypothetical protein
MSRNGLVATVRSSIASLTLILSLMVLGFASAGPASADTPPDPALSAGEMDALLAPIALYPDPMLAKVLIASTYPLEVVQAARWQQANSGLKGAALDSAVAKQDWDDSVKEMTRVPTLLTMMNNRLDWTQKLGDAFLGQQQELMQSVQRLRGKAQEKGTLKTTEHQTVQVVDDKIIIEPVEPEVAYVPYYDTQVVYGDWGYPSYPPYYWPAPPGYYYGPGLGFIAGAIIGAAWWGNNIGWGGGWGPGWGGGVYVDHHVNRNNFNQINGGNRINNSLPGRGNGNRVNNSLPGRGNGNGLGNGNRVNNSLPGSGNRWQHNPSHRRGVNYGNNNLRQQYGRGTMAGADSRRDFRGFDGNNAGNRNNNALGNRNGARNTVGNTSLGDRSAAGLNNRSLNNSRSNYSNSNFGQGNRGSNNFGGSNFNRSNFNSRGGGFDGIGSGRSTSQFSNRGYSSMNRSMSRGGGGMRGGGMSRGGGGMRGGGGGRRR